jgi:predicted nucleic acid-binding protein
MVRTLAAANLKITYSTAKSQMSYADCFAAALAQELNATLVTGDPEFQTLTSIIDIQFLQRTP